MANVGGIVNGGSDLAHIESKDPNLGRVLRKLLDGINTLATNTAASATGENQAPHAPQAVSVSTSGELAHISIVHNGPINRNIHYFTEIDTSPSFSSPIVYHHGTSRTPPPISLPTKDNSGITQNYYFRSYAQYPGSQPSIPTTVGGSSSPTAHTMGGTTQLTLLQSGGSGTASSNGQQGGWGLGKIQRRS